MSFTEITPYDGQLPSSDDPASFDGRAEDLMSWMVANFAPELQALAVEIATALNGEEDTLASLQALRDGLGTAATYGVSGSTDFTYLPSHLVSRSVIAAYVEDYVASQKPQIIATWEHSTDVSSIDFTDLGDWEVIKVSINIDVGSADNAILVSFDNGATFETSGYSSGVDDTAGGVSSTSRILLSRAGTGTVFAGAATLSDMSERVTSSSSFRMGDRGSSGGGRAPSGAVNAIRISLGADATAGRISVYGMVRR